MTAADAVLYLHFVYVSLVVLPVVLIPLGAKLGWRWVRNRALRITHLAMMGLVLSETFVGVVCPLTWLEGMLRGTKEERAFIPYWVHRLMFYDAPPWLFGVLYAAFFAAIAALWFLVPPVRRARER